MIFAGSLLAQCVAAIPILIFAIPVVVNQTQLPTELFVRLSRSQRKQHRPRASRAERACCCCSMRKNMNNILLKSIGERKLHLGFDDLDRESLIGT